jgi:hypothetical protein
MKSITGVTNIYLDYKLARHISVMRVTWQLRKEGRASQNVRNSIAGKSEAWDIRYMTLKELV